MIIIIIIYNRITLIIGVITITIRKHNNIYIHCIHYWAMKGYIYIYYMYMSPWLFLSIPSDPPSMGIGMGWLRLREEN